VAAAVIAAIIRLRLTGIVTRAWVRARQVTAELTGTLEELLGALEDIAGSGAGVHAERRLQGRTREVVERTLRAIVLDSAVGGSQTVFELGTTAALAMALLLYDGGRLTIGDVFMVATYGKLCLTPLMVLARQIQDLLPAGASAARGQELLATVPTVREVPEPRSLPDGPLELELRSVSFGYGDGEAALRDVDIELPAGAVLGVLGRTGSGKTTLARLLVRLHDPQRGSVRIGGVDLAEVAFDQLRRRVAYVPQETQLLDDTVRTNLTLAVGGATQAEDGELLAALETLGLGPWLAGRPDGLDAKVGPADGLSAGEGQLLALTRVFLRHPDLVILDEPSARLDPATEARLETAMGSLLTGRTAVIIAHRIDTLERATHLLVLEDGAVVEFGARSRLLADPTSRYARLRGAGLAEVLR
jgi:ABC-type multidrug transport system fused ATPase/permease subunit